MVDDFADRQAITPELVPSTDLAAAIALGSVGVNIARAIGPALGGLIVAASGPWAVFFLNAGSFIVVVVVIYRWRPDPRKSRLPPEDIIGAMRSENEIVLVRDSGAENEFGVRSRLELNRLARRLESRQVAIPQFVGN
jgi:MFS family permease